VHATTLQFDYACSGGGGRWVSVAAANRVPADDRVRLLHGGLLDIQEQSCCFLIRSRVAVTLTAEQWRTSLMSCSSSTPASRGCYDRSPERQGHVCGIRVLRLRTGNPGIRMASRGRGVGGLPAAGEASSAATSEGSSLDRNENL
jgi:hypothetical protein